MKKLALLTLSIVSILSAAAESYVPRRGEVKFKMLQTIQEDHMNQIYSKRIVSDCAEKYSLWFMTAAA